MELIVLGELHKINATLGEVLQLRPKGRNNRSITSAINAKGEIVQSLLLVSICVNILPPKFYKTFCIAPFKFVLTLYKMSALILFDRKYHLIPYF